MYLGISKNSHSAVNIFSADYNTFVSFDLNKIKADENDWLNLIKEIAFQLKGVISGFNLAFTGDIPVGQVFLHLRHFVVV